MRGARLAALLAFPVVLLHELGHYFASLPWADDSAVLLEPAGGRATCYVDFREDAPGWGIALSCIFPTVVGILVGVVALLWWGLAGLAVPADLEGWMRLSVAALSWGIFSWPSPADLEGARSGAPGVDDPTADGSVDS